MKLKIYSSPCETQIYDLQSVISLSFKSKLFEVKYCSFKIIYAAVSSVMKPPLPFQSVEVKQKQHCVNPINFFWSFISVFATGHISGSY